MKVKPGVDPTFDHVPFHNKIGRAKPKKVTELRVSEVNTQRYAAGSRNGAAGGQGPALDAK